MFAIVITSFFLKFHADTDCLLVAIIRGGNTVKHVVRERSWERWKVERNRQTHQSAKSIIIFETN